MPGRFCSLRIERPGRYPIGPNKVATFLRILSLAYGCSIIQEFPSSTSNGEKMKLLHRFASMICLFGLSANLGLSAQEATPAQPATAQSTTAQPAQTAPAQTTEPSTSTAAAPTTANAKPTPADASFNTVKVADAKGKQTDAHLIFSDSSNKLVVRVADRDFVAVPYEPARQVLL